MRPSTCMMAAGLLMANTHAAAGQLSVAEALTKNVADIGVYTHFGWTQVPVAR